LPPRPGLMNPNSPVIIPVRVSWSTAMPFAPKLSLESVRTEGGLDHVMAGGLDLVLPLSESPISTCEVPLEKSWILAKIGPPLQSAAAAPKLGIPVKVFSAHVGVILALSLPLSVWSSYLHLPLSLSASLSLSAVSLSHL